MMFFDKEAAMGDCERRHQICRPRTNGFSWTQVEHNEFKRFIIFRCVRCGSKNPEEVHWINPDIPFCAECLSQDMTMYNLGDQIVLVCVHCLENPDVTTLPHSVNLKELQDGSV